MRAWMGWFLLVWGGVLLAGETSLLQVVKLEARLESGENQKSLGVWLKGGYILAPSAAVHRFSPSVYAERIEVMIVDDPALPLIAFGGAGVVALDEDLGVALLRMERFSDIYGNPLPLSAFHEKVMKERGISRLEEQESDSSAWMTPVELAWGNLGLVSQGAPPEIQGSSFWDGKGNFQGIITALAPKEKRTSPKEIKEFVCTLAKKGLLFKKGDPLLGVCAQKESKEESVKSPKLANFK